MPKSNEGLSNYEAVLIIGADKDREKAEEIAKAAVEFLKKKKAEKIKLDFWEKKQFAYKIKQQNEGFYFILRFAIGRKLLSSFEKHLQTSEEILRFLVLRKGV